MENLQCPVPWSLVVVDNGSTDNTREVILAAERTLPVAVRYIHEPTPGLGYAHNAGVRATQAEILAFTDDDCYPEPDYLTSVAECFAEDARLGFLGGKILIHDPDDCADTLQLSDTRIDFPSPSFIPPGVIQGANFSCRREAVVGVGGFDPWFGPGAYFNAEEVELLARLSAAGWSGAYDPRPTISHHHGRKAADMAKILRSYNRGIGAYYAKSLLNPRLTGVFLRTFLFHILSGRRERSRHEILSGGAAYFLRVVSDRGRRFARTGLMAGEHGIPKELSSASKV
jgi:GT2 family glycosyltransferase